MTLSDIGRHYDLSLLIYELRNKSYCPTVLAFMHELFIENYSRHADNYRSLLSYVHEYVVMALYDRML
jgi:hypothetical protein